MGKCIYCGEKAGFFKKKHQECELKFNEGQLRYVDLIKSSILSEGNLSHLADNLLQIRQTSFLNDELHHNLVTIAFDQSVAQLLEDGLTIAEEEKITRFCDFMQLGQDSLDKNGSYQKLGMAAILREITEGRIPQLNIRTDSPLPFLFQKSETLIWVFAQVEYYEQRTRTEYQGGSHGLSLKVTKGVYYRASAFKGRPVQISEMKYIGTGILALTTKHVYFGSPEKKVKIPFNKLISIEPYEDGIGLHKDGVSAKHQVFKNIDGWFTQNAITNLNQG
jgi:hypothetical protein